METKNFYAKVMKSIMVVALCLLPLSGKAQLVKYCMSYADFVADKWSPIEELTEGRTKQAVQMKFDNNEFKFKTGDKQADAAIKKQVFAIQYGQTIYVNCRNLREDDVILETSGYMQAYRYDHDKLCVAVYHVNDAAFLASLGADVAWFFVDTPVRIGLDAAQIGLILTRDKLNSFRCFLIDKDCNAKGRYPVTRMNDKFMGSLLADDTAMLEKYNAVSSKRQRQSAANVLPILMEKGLVNAEL